jgi:uncharacterized protein
VAKLLLVVAVFTVVYLILRSYRRKIERQESRREQPGPDGRGASRHGEDMVRCRICGVHLPKSEAVTSRGEMFCSREHLQLAGRDGSGR